MVLICICTEFGTEPMSDSSLKYSRAERLWDCRQTEEYFTYFCIIEVLKTTSLELGCPVLVLQSSFTLPKSLLSKKQLPRQKPEGILLTALLGVIDCGQKIKSSPNISMGRAEKLTKVRGDLTNVWKKMSRKHLTDEGKRQELTNCNSTHSNWWAKGKGRKIHIVVWEAPKVGIPTVL